MWFSLLIGGAYSTDLPDGVNDDDDDDDGDGHDDDDIQDDDDDDDDNDNDDDNEDDDDNDNDNEDDDDDGHDDNADIGNGDLENQSGAATLTIDTYENYRVPRKECRIDPFLPGEIRPEVIAKPFQQVLPLRVIGQW